MSPSPRLQRSRRRKRTVKKQKRVDNDIVYGEHIAAVTKALVSQRFNPNYKQKTPFEKNWDNIKMPEDTTVKIANLWKSQYLTRRNLYNTRTKPAASYYGLL